MPKLQPAVQTLHYRLQGNQDYGYIDLAEGLSIVNRRFYRQGMQYAIGGIQIFNGSSVSGRILIEKLPTTWPLSNSWHKAFAFWIKQQNEAIADSGSESAVAKFRDFKVYADKFHMNSHAGGTSNLLPQTSPLLGTGAAVNPLQGEWEYSQIVLPNVIPDGTGSEVDPAEYYLYMLGENRSGIGKGVVDGYQSSRSYPQSPDPVSPSIGNADNWLSRMFNVGNDNPEVVSNATDKNDDLPYDQDAYPGSELQMPNMQLHDMVDITGTQNFQWSMKGGIIPCGLLKVYKETSTGSDVGDITPSKVLDILIHMVPGDHRGYLAEPMQDM